MQAGPLDNLTTEILRAVRDAALAQMEGSKAAYRADVALKSYDALGLSDQQERDPLALEAFVAAVIAHGKRPRRAQKSLYRLTQHRMAQGEQDLYDAFAERIEGAEQHGFSLEGIFLQRALADVDQTALWGDTAAAIKSVEDVFGPAFLNSGTLLGAVREGGFIAHDDDVDIAVLMKATTPQEAAAQWIEGYETLVARGLVAQSGARRNPAVFKLKSTTGVNIDVFPAWLQGDKLIVGCSTDEFNSIKGKSTAIPYAHRVEILEACRYVDQVIPEEDWAQKRDDVQRYGVGLFAMGDDCSGKFDELRDLCDVLYLPRTENISTTELKALIQSMRGPAAS